MLVLHAQNMWLHNHYIMCYGSQDGLAALALGPLCGVRAGFRFSRRALWSYWPIARPLRIKAKRRTSIARFIPHRGRLPRFIAVAF